MFRNREFVRFSLLYTVIATVFIIAGFFIGVFTGLLFLLSVIVFGLIFFIFTRTRYQKLSYISNQINLVLHNADRLDLSGFEEGELSILHNDITKMTVRIREQNEALIKEKEFLADSLADIAHQLRTPLTSANLILSLLSKKPTEEETVAFIRELDDLLMRMDWLITSLLKIYRLDAGVTSFKAETVAVNELIKASTQAIAIPLELRCIDVSVDIPDCIYIQGDLEWLAEAILNIIKNCMESIGNNGTINLTCTDNNIYTEIYIHDSGDGFNENDIPRLFNRFYRGINDNATGYGIGLALSKMIITGQGGSLIAKNHPDGGAMFSIRFPQRHVSVAV